MSNNTGAGTEVSLECDATGNVICTGQSSTGAWMSKGQKLTVDVYYSVGAQGSGSVGLHSSAPSNDDSGWYGVTITAPQGKPGLSLRKHNDDNHARPLCLTTGAGESAAWQCGDLLISHAMPSITTLGRERNLTLVYNSAQASPYATVMASVTQGGSISAPTAVQAELRVNGILRDSTTFGSWGFSGSDTRQIGLTFDASGDSSGIYPFSLTVRNQYGASAVFDSTVTGELLIVNRTSSPYGRGWSLAGVEELVLGQSGGRILWIGGDGSARVYRPAGVNRWEGAHGAYRDTIVLANSEYTRTLRYGVQVVYDATGHHIRTTNRQRQTTVFAWNSTTGGLASVSVPPAGQTHTTYAFTYDAAGKLDHLDDPVGRRLNVTVSGGLLTSILDPDDKSTSFTYLAGTPAGRISVRTDRRGIPTRYSWRRWRVSAVKLPLDATGSDTAVTYFQPWDQKGVRTTYPNTGTVTAADTATAYTKIIGARPGVADDAMFWVDRWGAPVKIEDPMGNITMLARGDTSAPALVTQIVRPNGRRENMTYNDRGNLLETRVVTSHLGNPRPDRVVSYAYDTTDNVDSPIQVCAAPGRCTSYAYEPLTGQTRRITDARGHVTDVIYRLATGDTLFGLVDSLIERGVSTWRESDSADVMIDLGQRFRYNSRGVMDRWVNFTFTTVYGIDSAGRVTSATDPLGRRRYFAYDPMNRPLHNEASAIAFPVPADTCYSAYFNCARLLEADPWYPSSALIRSYWGAAGLDSVIDPRGVKRVFGINPRGMQDTETDEFGQTMRSYYGPSGLLDSTRSRAGLLVTRAYDAAGRMTRLIYPAQPGQPTWNGQSSVTIAGDTLDRTYDSMGQLLVATLSTGEIRRTYYPDGLLRTRVSVFKGNKDSLYFEYDATGARTLLRQNGTDEVRYQYEATSGLLERMLVKFRGQVVADTFEFTWDELGRRKSIRYPNQMLVMYHYGPLGKLRRIVSNGPGNFDFDYHMPSVDRLGLVWRQTVRCSSVLFDNAGAPCQNRTNDDFANAYSWSGFLVRQEGEGVYGGGIDTMVYDVSGNLLRRFHASNGTTGTFTVPRGTNRLTAHNSRSPLVDVAYNLDGARLKETPVDPSQVQAYRWFYYDGLGRTRGSHYLTLASGGGYEAHDNTHCEYDADGQMVQRCQDGQILMLDGANIVGTIEGWRFAHGPGVDDPLVGNYTGTGDPLRVYFVTDGAGRRIAVGDANGELNNDVGARSRWTDAGAVAGGSTFDADRLQSDAGGLNGVSFFRNRAYDSRTGRWTQEDPIGLAGGVNLYQFNGNNPVAYTDPFGLCKKPKGLKKGQIGICIETFIKGGPLLNAIGVADGRGPSSDGGSYRTSDRFIVDLATGAVSGNQSGDGLGKTFGRFKGYGYVDHSSTLGPGGTIQATGQAMNGLGVPPYAITYDLELAIGDDGSVSVSGTHDGYPSYEVWVYEDGKDPYRAYYHPEGDLLDLRPPAEVTAP